MHVTSFWTAVGAGILGLMLANLAVHPQGTQAIGNAVVSGEKVGVNGLIGTPTA